MVDFHYRCPMPDNIPEIDAWKPGDLHKMFERIVADFPHVNVLSQPSTVEEEDGPWVITIDHFLADEECERLIELGHEQGYERSADVGKMNWDGTFEDSINDGRTSTNAWCDEGCRDDPLTKAVLHKIENLTGVPDNSSEFLQLLRYEPGQYYRQHHDYIDIDLERPQGVRILTVFLYLNEPEAGGGTNFPYLGDDDGGGLTVMPKKGRVLLWPSVLDEDPNAADLRTEHQALDVEKGLKYGANAWVHQRDFKTPHNASCA
jgi:prolyl 4-hydroxylase